MFGFSARRKEPLIDRRRSLTGIPVVNNGVATTEVAPGRIDIVARRPRGKGFLARFQPAVLERTVKLDEMGTFVYRQIDGRRDVLAIIDIFMGRHRTNRREAELSVAAFLKSLAERRVISIVIK